MRIIDFRYAPQIIQTCICLVDDQHKTIVREDGSINYGYQLNQSGLDDAWIQAGESTPGYAQVYDENLRFKHRLKPRFTHRDILTKCTQDYGDASSPFVTTTEEYEHTRFQWTIFAYKNKNNLRADIIRWSLTTSDQFGYAPSRVELLLKGTGNGVPAIIESAGTTAYWTNDGFNLDGITHYAFLGSGEERHGVFAIILEGELSPEEVTTEWVEHAELEMQNYWKELEVFKKRFQIPDPQIMDMLRACGRNILQAREVKDSGYEFQVGPTVYRGLWIVDGHFILEAAHMMGQRNAAYQGLDAVLRRAKADGSIQIMPDHTKETGIALATFVRQCELMNDDERLRELWPTMLKALVYIKRQNDEAEQLGVGYEAHGLFPPAFMDGGIAGPFPEYSTPLWILIGLKWAYESGKRLKLPEYDVFKSLYVKIRQALLAAIERDRRKTETGETYFPMNMQKRDYDKPQSATWSLAHAIYPGELFDLDDPVVTDFLSLLDSVDNKQGIPEETGWLHDQAVWAYSSMFYAQCWLYAGRADKAVDYLYACANHAAPSRVWREEQSLVASHANEYCGDMPHNWASAEFIRLVRHLLIFERDGNLEIFPGLPPEWLPVPQCDLVLEESPTRYGAVSISLKWIEEDVYEFSFFLSPDNKKPGQVVLHWQGNVMGAEANLEKQNDGMWVCRSDSLTIMLTFKGK